MGGGGVPVLRVCEHTFVRWSNLTEDSAEQRRLPGYRDPAAVRRFDAPEALDTRFYEVHAKSVLNRVPEQSRMPFRWSVNPYRGCSHGCVYCVDPSTRILLADGSTKPISELTTGEGIYGTVRLGKYRRFVTTTVLAKWSTIKPAYRILLEDGTELIASGDHRFLTDRGWKHVTGAEWGPTQRPHLTINNKLIGVGAFAQPPEQTADYRRGYLCGLIRGDGHIGSYSYVGPGRNKHEVHGFRLALADEEALTRADGFLGSFGVSTNRCQFSPAAPNRRPIAAIRTGVRAASGDPRPRPMAGSSF